MKNYKFCAISTIVFTIVVCRAFGDVSLTETHENPGHVRSISDVPTPKVVFLGNVEGKSYFYDEERMSWEAANVHCNLSGMHLATINTPAQATFLADAYDSELLPTGFLYWVGAREARDLRMYSWDITGNDVTAISSLQDMLGTEYLACLCFYSSGGVPTLRALKCTSSAKVLCETNI